MKHTRQEFNGLTGEITIVEMTDAEVSEIQNEMIIAENEKKEAEAIEAAKKAAKESAIAKLAALGLTEDEAKAIIE